MQKRPVFKRYTVLIGNFGSGKTELALNLAMQAAAQGSTMLVDMDIINPYFKSSSKQEMLEAADYSCLLPLEYGLEHLPVLNLPDEKSFDDVLHGRHLVWKEQIPAGTYKLFYQNRIVAVAAADGKTLKMRKVLISEND